MNKSVSVINNKNDMSMNTRGMVEGSFAIAKFSTEDECVYSYVHANALVDSFYKREHDGAVSFIRARSLMELKKLIMNDLWSENLANVPIDLVDRWYKRMKEVGLWDEKNKCVDRYVGRLLRFANYNETSKLSTVSVVAPSEFQVRSLYLLMYSKNNNKSASMIEVSKTYEILAKQYNNGKPFKGSKEIKTAFEKFEGQVLPKKPKKPKKVEEVEEVEEVTVCVRDIFVNEHGECPDITLAPMEFPAKVIGKLPDVTATEWKKFYRLVASVIHPDQGGDKDMTAILTSLNRTMNVVFDHVDETEAVSDWNADYKQWMDDNNYESSYVPESEVRG